MRWMSAGRGGQRVLSTACGLLLATMIVATPAAADQAASKNNEGNHLYEQKKYDEALKMYVDAQASRPGAPQLHYNIGNVLYRKKEFDKAIEEYVRAQAAPDPVLSQAASFNRGNAFLMQGRPEEAIKAYVEALRARPDDTDAKRNLELALRLLEQQKKQQQQQNQQQKNKDQDKSPQQQPQPSDGGGSPPQQKKPGEMTEEEARQVLEALQQEEKEGIKKHARAMAGDRRQPEQDW
jgi:tetratricopeptide (TPR) repeat protein